MNILVCSSVLLIAYWAFCEGQTDYSKMDPEKLLYINYTNEMFNKTAQLFLKWGTGGLLHNNRCICWTSNSSGPSTPMYHRSLRFFNQTIKDSGHWEQRDTYWAAGAVNYTPKVRVISKLRGKDDPETSIFYTLFFATPTCFVMGLLEGAASTESVKPTQSPTGETDNSTCHLWAQRHNNQTDDREKCEKAFTSNCSSILVEGKWYRRGHKICNYTDDTDNL
ncbi:uncharacterized protein LOC119399892 isoform X2 [Rhipicephalus sanguineus]|uniref:uncharacterized protein LOC119399892 isoform X2 n=1 Tax=Rhipicephalus sanguineus TaxID=34632 RepID=UPI001895822A|nr:uncharacterized protein LOC119399892 isoform X2 [Rhipicephalus sanguineus]